MRWVGDHRRLTTFRRTRVVDGGRRAREGAVDIPHQDMAAQDRKNLCVPEQEVVRSEFDGDQMSKVERGDGHG